MIWIAGLLAMVSCAGPAGRDDGLDPEDWEGRANAAVALLDGVPCDSLDNEIGRAHDAANLVTALVGELQQLGSQRMEAETAAVAVHRLADALSAQRDPFAAALFAARSNAAFVRFQHVFETGGAYTDDVSTVMPEAASMLTRIGALGAAAHDLGVAFDDLDDFDSRFGGARQTIDSRVDFLEVTARRYNNDPTRARDTITVFFDLESMVFFGDDILSAYDGLVAFALEWHVARYDSEVDRIRHEYRQTERAIRLNAERAEAQAFHVLCACGNSWRYALIASPASSTVIKPHIALIDARMGLLTRPERWPEGIPSRCPPVKPEARLRPDDDAEHRWLPPGFSGGD
jgi:hypothetical protein